MKVKVGIQGYGTIGKRVADAILKQDDMELVGVTKTRPSWEAKVAIEKGIGVYSDNAAEFSAAGIKLAGSIKSLVEKCDIIVDCTPKKIGAANKETFYVPMKKKAIFQGGEKANVAETSFNPTCNYNDAFGKNYVRVVSCNTTGLSTTVGALHKNFQIGKVRATMVRRAADPADIDTGPINAIVPEVKVPSHHGPDVQTVIPGLDIVTTAVEVPTTIMHLHAVSVELKKTTSVNEILDVWKKTPRIRFVRSDQGITSTAQIMELARDMGRNRADMYETTVWEDSVNVHNNELYFFQAVHQESIVVPSTIDCIRAMFNLEKDAMKSIQKTDKSLGIGK